MIGGIAGLRISNFRVGFGISRLIAALVVVACLPPLLIIFCVGIVVICAVGTFFGHLIIHNVIDNDHWRHLFLLYGIDKTQAKLNNWRVPELELHVLALIGGFIGGWLGMFIFRHKTKKPIFKVVLAISTLIGIVLFYFFVLQR